MNTYTTLVEQVGHPSVNIEGWPSHDVAGLFDALSRWTLDPSLGDCKCRAWESVAVRNAETGRTTFEEVRPMFPEHPEAMSYSGNFLRYSFCFHIVTHDTALIAALDAAIAANGSIIERAA